MSRFSLLLLFGMLGAAACHMRTRDAGIGDGGLADRVVSPDVGAEAFVYPDLGPAPDLPAACSNCPDAPVLLVTMPLECLCPWFWPHCPATVGDFVRQFCDHDSPLVKMVGCGKVTFPFTSRYGAATPIFDLASGRLIGVYDSSDTTFGRCRVSNYLYGTGLFAPDWLSVPPADVCADITFCTICGPPDPRYPRCPS